MLKKITLIFGLLITNLSIAVTWTDTISIDISDTILDSKIDPTNGNIVSTGFTQDIGGIKKMFIKRTTQNGFAISEYAPTGIGQSWGNSISIDPYGNTYVSGGFSGNVIFDPYTQINTTQPSASFVLKTDNLDLPSWVRIHESPTIGTDSQSFSVSADLYTKIYTSGTHNSTNGIGNSYFEEFDNLGASLLIGEFSGVGNSNGYSITTDPYANSIIVGSFTGTVQFDSAPGALPTTQKTSNGSDDIFIAKHDPTGLLLWVKTIGGGGFDSATNVITDQYSNIITSGEFSNSVVFDTYAATPTLTTSLGSTDTFIVTFDSYGTYVGNFSLGTVDQNTAGGVVINNIGDKFLTTTNVLPGNISDISLTKIENSTNNLLWTKTIKGLTGAIDANSINIIGEDIVVSGGFSGTITFDPYSVTLTANGQDGYINLFDLTTPIASSNINTLTNLTNPINTITSNEDGTASYTGVCSTTPTTPIINGTTNVAITISGAPTPPNESTYSDCTVTISDNSGNTTLPIPLGVFTVDTSPPVAPVVLSPTTNTITSSAIYPIISGTAETGSFITVTDAYGQINYSGTATLGLWSVTGSPATIVEGTRLFTITSTDAANNSSTTNLTYISDRTPPIINLTPTTNIEATSITTSATATNIVAFLTSTTTTDATTTTLTNDAAAIGPFTLNVPKTITFNATDAAGNTSSATTILTMVDTANPIITPPTDVFFEATSGTLTPITPPPAPIVIDLYTASITHDIPPAGYPIGTNIITWTATDTSGLQTVVTQNAIIQDTTPPTFTTNPLPQVNIEAGSNVVVNDPYTFDFYQTNPPTITNNLTLPLSFGPNTITWTATDVYSNTSTLSQNINIVDTTPPTITPPTTLIVEANNILSTVTPTTPTVTDASTTYGQIIKITNDAPTSYPLGNTTVTWTTTDSSGNTSSTTQTITVQDTTPPAFTNATLGILPTLIVTSTLPGAITTIPTPAITDIFPTTTTNNAPTTFTSGSNYNVIWTSIDANGNTSTATQVVSTIDNVPPVFDTLTTPDLIAEANDILSTITLTTPSTTDVSKVTITNNAPVTLPIGTTIVTWTAVDASSNTSTQDQNITIVDTTSPIFTSVLDVVETNTKEPNATANLVTPEATDIFPITITNNAPSTYPLGDTIIIWTATDDNGNTSTIEQVVRNTDANSSSCLTQTNQNILKTIPIFAILLMGVLLSRRRNKL